MSSTTNYSLYVTDDSSETFKTWFEQMSGTSDSNMTKIDTALGDKAEASITIDATLSTDEWAESGSLYSQVISVDGLTATQNGVVGISSSASSTEREMARIAKLSVSTQEDGALTIVADGTKPTADIPITIILLG